MPEPTSDVRSLEELLRTMMLPISDGKLPSAAEVVRTGLNGAGIARPDHGELLSLEWHKWQDGAGASTVLRRSVTNALLAESELPKGFPQKYFELVLKLQESRHMGSVEAISLAGNALLVERLLRVERMSCAQVAAVLGVTQNNYQYTWEMVQDVARTLDHVPGLDREAVDQLHASDAENEEWRFADASLDEAVEVVAQAGESLGYGGDLGSDLRKFLADFKPAYGVMLHYSCIVLEFFDHPPQKSPYEFQPRGAVVHEMSEKYHQGYEASSNPYLNNAKGASALDRPWAWSRQSSFVGSALAFVAILESLASMPFPARRELAGWIRQLFHRKARLAVGSYAALPRPTMADVRATCAGLAVSNSGTRGVLEQRLVDVWAVLNHPGLAARGLGDHVNAANVPRRKLGDVEFSDSRSGEIFAYEAHGGALADVYVEQHRRTLAAVLRARREELEFVMPAYDWLIRVRFVAHDLGSMSNVTETVEGFAVSWEFYTFRELAAQLTADPRDIEVNEAYQEHFIDRLNHSFVPEAVREKCRALASADSS